MPDNLRDALANAKGLKNHIVFTRKDYVNLLTAIKEAGNIPEFITTEELFLELSKRMKSFICIYEEEGEKEGYIANNYQYSGSISEVLGLLQWFKITFTKSLNDL